MRIRGMTFGWLLAALTILCPAAARAVDLTLAKDGGTAYIVLTATNPSATERFAAEELAGYLRRMSGAEFEVQPVAAPLPTHAIYVSTEQNLFEFGPVAARALENDDSFAVSTRAPHSLTIVGKTPRATLFAVYQFLDALGCRFLAPGFDHYKGSAEVVPRLSTITFAQSQTRRSTPRLKFRKLYVEEGLSHTTENLVQLIEWMPKVRYNTLVVPTDYQGKGQVKWDNFRDAATPELQKRDITLEVGGHGYQNFLNASMDGGKLFEKHPEYFHQDAAGKRLSDTDHNVFCTSNQAAVAYLTGNFLAYIRTRPEIQIYDFWPPDGAKWCTCANCRALGSPADRQALLLSHVNAEAKKVRPDLRLEVIAYSSYVAPPEKHPIDPAVLVDFCPINQQFDRQIDDPESARNSEYVKHLNAWRQSFRGDLSIYSYYRKYAWDSLPVLLPHYIQRDLKFYAALPTQGVSTYSEPGDWATYELNHYCLAALACDPDADVDKLVEKFAAARFGPAGPVAREAFAALEDTVRTTCSIPFTPLKSPDAIAAGRERVEKAIVALEAAKPPEAAHQLAVRRLVLACTYAVKDLELQHLRATTASRDEVRPKVEALRAFLSDHKDDGLFVTSAFRLSPDRLLRRFGHPATRPAAREPARQG